MDIVQAAHDLLPTVARLKARKIGRVEGSEIFAIPAGWAAGMLRAESGIVTAETPTALEMAVQDENVRAIFVPRDTFGFSMLERILGRNGQAKTIFWEE